MSVCVRACGIKVSCYSLGAPVGRTLRSSRRPPSPWRRLIWVGGDRGRGEPDNAPRRKPSLLSCFQPDRCQFKRGESEGAGERAGERWSRAAGTEGGGERKERPRRAEDASAAPALLWLALAAPPSSSPGEDHLCHVMWLKLRRADGFMQDLGRFREWVDRLSRLMIVPDLFESFYQQRPHNSNIQDWFIRSTHWRMHNWQGCCSRESLSG